MNRISDGENLSIIKTIYSIIKIMIPSIKYIYIERLINVRE